MTVETLTKNLSIYTVLRVTSDLLFNRHFILTPHRVVFCAPFYLAQHDVVTGDTLVQSMSLTHRVVG